MKSLVLSPEMLEGSYAFKDWAGIKSIHQLSRKCYDRRSGKEAIGPLAWWKIASEPSAPFVIASALRRERSPVHSSYKGTRMQKDTARGVEL